MSDAVDHIDRLGTGEPPISEAPQLAGMKPNHICVEGTLTRRNACGSGCADRSAPGCHMMFFIVLLLVLWFLGVVTTYTLGGLLHILLVLAIVMFLVHIIQGSRIGDA